MQEHTKGAWKVHGGSVAGRGCAVRAVAIFSIFQSNNFAVSWRHAVACVGSMWWRRQQIFQNFFFQILQYHDMLSWLRKWRRGGDGGGGSRKISKNFKNFQKFSIFFLLLFDNFSVLLCRWWHGSGAASVAEKFQKISKISNFFSNFSIQSWFLHNCPTDFA